MQPYRQGHEEKEESHRGTGKRNLVKREVSSQVYNHGDSLVPSCQHLEPLLQGGAPTTERLSSSSIQFRPFSRICCTGAAAASLLPHNRDGVALLRLLLGFVVLVEMLIHVSMIQFYIGLGFMGSDILPVLSVRDNLRLTLLS